jgi:hypothetical protein
LFGIFGASELMPVTPKRMTGFTGRKALREYGSHSHGGCALWEITSTWGILELRQLQLRKLFKTNHFSIALWIIPLAPALAVP